MRAVAILLTLMALAFAAAWAIILTEPANPVESDGVGAGDLVYTQGTYSVRLTESACDHEELELAVLTQGGIGEARAAIVSYGATRRAGCWARTPHGDYVVRDYRSLDQGEGVLLKEWFHPPAGLAARSASGAVRMR